jgi:hypothetical protein
MVNYPAINKTKIPFLNTPAQEDPCVEQIFDALNLYRTKYVSRITLNTQNPDELTRIKRYLCKRGNQLESYFKGGPEPKSIYLDESGLEKDDLFFKELMDTIRPLLTQCWTFDKSVWTQEFCKILFKENVFQLSPEHIKRIKQNFTQQQVDGRHTQMPEGVYTS